MIQTLLKILLVIVAFVTAVLLFEGGYAIAKWKLPTWSITYDTYRKIKDRNKFAKAPPETLAYTQLLSLAELEKAVPYLKEADAGLGNSPFEELVTEAAAVNHEVGGCLEQKPNVAKTMTYLRTNLFNPLDPMTLFHDRDRALPAEVEELIDRYGVRKISHSTNAVGERRTFPMISSDVKVLIAGDSVANGSMVDDSETIASQMQAGDPTRQYINLGVGNAGPHDIFCALDQAARRYAGQIDSLVYVYCENDFPREGPEWGPAAVVERLKVFAKDVGIDEVTVVYAPYIYNIVPQFTRFRGYRGGRARTRMDERLLLADQSRAAGFRYIDIADVALEEAAVAGTQFAVLSHFVDHMHLSPYGTARLVKELQITR
jgi:hypothetical protein